MTFKKRFIAGAVCPHCHALDSIQWLQEADDERIQCIHCSYMQKKSELSSPNPTTANGVREHSVKWSTHLKSSR